ncbi:Long-chain-fatty-acid--CoA ligase [Sulfurimonas gotlandica GD1]|uniref:Long-chain-fatty-acid--CoA ligase n=1 Tax=Sulfurimonas gotlandica (strain DSM 19862 / JCM 16533 / GD1) TaxID=929558 RepID=B6BK37_SULGG|nr:AMP-binding protein [Sulfurimonas gotlandica]EDZ62491.1 AMP-binding enzyme family protein [Sulfurimonas gotlandica GD1]EHP31128.1 Long-chain-fatty-acid--CoA ligase [Sulfurimonas gotlandica GD1]
MNYPYENLENFTLPRLFDRSVNRYGEEPSLAKVGEEPMSYNQLNEKVKATVQLLQKSGISKGDKVVLLSENMPNWAVAYFSVTYFNAVIVPILPDFHPSDVHHIIRHSEAKAVFVSDKFLPTIEDANDLNIQLVINLEKLEIIEEISNQSYISQLKQKISKSSIKITEPKEDDLAAIIYTSGTTGHSKGVMLSHKNLVTNALSSFSKITIHKSDIFLSILPLAHTLECTVGLIVPILHGSSVHYIDKVPTPSVLLKAFSVVRPTMMLSVPLIIEKIYKNKVLAKFNSSFILKHLYKIPFFRKILNKAAGKKLIETFGGRVRFFGIGGAALSPFVEQFLMEAEFPYIIGYGLTETSPLIAGGSIIDGIVKVKSTGTPFYGVTVKIKDKDPKTGEGEIIVKSPSVMLGYYKDEEKTKEVMEDGWFLTGDLGYMDEDGFLFISGRSKNVIIGSGGENIYPEQIEAVINQNEAVLDSLVMEQDSKLIARVHLDYEMIDEMFKADRASDAKVKEDIANFLEELRVDVNTQVASFSKVNKFVEQIEPFIKTPTKKIKRYLYVE